MLQGRFTLHDFLEQIRTLQQMGPLQDLFEKLPFFADSMPEGFEVDPTEPPIGTWRRFEQGWRVLPQDADTDGMVLIRYRRMP